MRVHGATLRCTDECLRLVGGPEKGDPLGGATTVFSTPFTTETHNTQLFLYTKETDSITMHSGIALGSRAIRVAATTVIRRPHAHAHARTLTTVGPRAAPSPTRPATDQAGGLHPEKGPNRNALYIGGGLAAIGAIWYYYAMVENPRVEVRGGAEGLGGGQSVEDAGRAVKGRTQDALKSGDAKYQDIKAEAQSKVQAAGDQVGQGVERGKQRFEELKDQAAHRASEAHVTAGK